MKTKIATLIAAALFALPLTASAEKQFNTFKFITFGEKTIEIWVEVENAVKDIHINLTEIFQNIRHSEESSTEPQFDISELLYEEPTADDFGFDTKAVFDEILKEKTVK